MSDKETILLTNLDFQECENNRFGDCIGEVTFGPNPFSEEIYGDLTPHWMCEECRYQSAMDI